MAGSPIFELLERSKEHFVGADLVIAGDVLDEQLLHLAKETTKTVVIVDNYAVAKKMAALIGQTIGNSYNESVTYKHLTVIFAPVVLALKKIESLDTLLICLNKSKAESVNILNLLKPKFKENTRIFVAGSNTGGGKSADGIINVAGPTFKIDSARKCTLFMAKYEQDFNTAKPLNNLDVKVLDLAITLKQDCAVFSQGKIDDGTALMLPTLRNVPVPHNEALDLGCGCGIIGITLAKLGFKKVTCADVSATALYLTAQNAELNGVKDTIKVVASDMLTGLDSYDLIAVNPPFHKGLDTAIAPTLSMIEQAPEHLVKGGILYLVGNTFLGYTRFLTKTFSKVNTVEKTTRFEVVRASV